jgi:hypothetical protein
MDSTETRIAAAQQATQGTIVMEGDFLRPQFITADELRTQALVSADPFDLHCYTTNRFIRSIDGYRGTLLRELILRAGLPVEPAGAFKRMVFIAVAHDGYAVTFSWHELFNTPVGERVIVAQECGGRLIEAEQGAPILFSGADTLPAPRHMKRLARIVARVLSV